MTAPIDWDDDPEPTTDQPDAPGCGRPTPHPSHRYMLGLLMQQCPGTTEPRGPIDWARQQQAERGQQPATCPDCGHDQHGAGTECEHPISHGPLRFHRCLCLARPGADRACPPLMNCQGGTLGYADIWHLQQGHSVQGADGTTITPDVLTAVPEQPARHTADSITDLALDQLYAERDMYGRDADRLRKDWVEMRTRAEQAEAAIRRALERMEAYRAAGCTGVNPRQVINLLALTWPDGNFEAPRDAAALDEPKEPRP